MRLNPDSYWHYLTLAGEFGGVDLLLSTTEVEATRTRPKAAVMAMAASRWIAVLRAQTMASCWPARMNASVVAVPAFMSGLRKITLA